MYTETFDLYTDDSCNLSREWLSAHGVGLFTLGVSLDSKDYPIELREDTKPFYAAVRQGARPLTSSIPRGVVEDAFKSSLERGRDVLYLGLPAKLSNNCQQIKDIGSELAADSPKTVYCMDSRAVIMGLGMMVMEAVRLRDEGKSPEEICSILEEMSSRIRVFFMLDDPQYLKAGGRGEEALEWVARTASKLSVKPLLVVNRQAALKFHSAYRSRKRAINQMIERLRTLRDKSREQIIYVQHADIPEVADMIAEAVRAELGDAQRVEIVEAPLVIGVHVGPSALALVFLSDTAKN
jgi:DegV family protein with EDD domain